jgi:hypothetical protein
LPVPHVRVLRRIVAEISSQIDYQKVAARRSGTGDFHFVALLPACRYSSAISASANMNLVHYPFFSLLVTLLIMINYG